MKAVRSTVCRVSRPWARMVAVDRQDPTPLIGRHAGTCLRCQAEMAVEHRITRTLAATGRHLMLAPAGLVAGAMSRLDAPVPPADREVPKVAIAAAAVAVASGLAWTLSRRAKGAA